MKILSAGALGVLLMAYQFFADGFMLSRLWAWYAVPLGAQAVRWQVFAVAVGAWQCLRYRANGKKDDRSEAEQTAAVAISLGYPWVVLLIAWWWL